ncbi:MAG: hypothetical protein DMF71_11850 [Acidobacteria bacterium]|nr:MAG: hypothetical protein DMF71_11850 [Acidobacteriota bacterium]
MIRRVFLTASITASGLIFGSFAAIAQTPQTTDVPRYEVAEDFSSLSLDSGTTLPGFGGRFTYNLNRNVALEAAGYFFPGHCNVCIGETTGHVTEGLFGVKAGKRFKRWGIFGKARPGFMSFGQGGFNVIPLSSGPSQGQINCFGNSQNNFMPCFRIESTRVTPAAIDLGGVLEFYPSKRIVVRFDGGDTILHYARRTFNTLTADPANPTSFVPILVRTTDPAFTRHTFQFIAGVGFRF